MIDGVEVDAANNNLARLGWAFLIVCSIVTTIVMLNLLIAIISGRFENVRR